MGGMGVSERTRLDPSRRKAFRQLEKLGFTLSQHRGDITIRTPEGFPLGSFSTPQNNKQTPQRLHSRFREWEMQRGRFAK